MKKVLPLLFICFLLFNGLALASPSNNDSEVITTPQEIHKVVVANHWGSLTTAGQLVVNVTAADLGVSDTLFNQYLSDVSNLNNAVKEGLLTFNYNLEMNVLTPEEYKDYAVQEGINFRIQSQFIVPFSDPGAPPFRNAYSIAAGNLATLKNFYNSAMTSYMYSGYPNAGAMAYSASIGFFIGKVQEGGEWDYKVQPGWSPWYNQFTFAFRSGTEVQNSAYLGNYNYGYVGKYLFSLSVLIAGGDGVSILTGKHPDGEDDKAPIRRGYNENY